MHGRKTYELMAGVWPAAGNDPDLPPLMAEFAGIWCTIPKFVFSRSLTQAGWGRLVDEFRIYVHPIVLGQGRPLFEDPDIRLNLTLRQTHRFGNGVVLFHYANDAGPTP